MSIYDQIGVRTIINAKGTSTRLSGGFLDPEVYAPDRLLTVVGWLTGSSPEKVGGYAYDAPIVDAYSVHLWQPLPPAYPYAWGPGPYWGWGPGVWVGPGYGPWGPWGPGPWYRPWYW